MNGRYQELCNRNAWAQLFSSHIKSRHIFMKTESFRCRFWVASHFHLWYTSTRRTTKNGQILKTTFFKYLENAFRHLQNGIHICSVCVFFFITYFALHLINSSSFKFKSRKYTFHLFFQVPSNTYLGFASFSDQKYAQQCCCLVCCCNYVCVN